MKNLFIYYITVNIPLVIILSLYFNALIPVSLFAIFIVFEAFIYRPIIDYFRLKSLGIIKPNDFRKMFGFYRFKFYKEILFGVK